MLQEKLKIHRDHLSKNIKEYLDANSYSFFNDILNYAVDSISNHFEWSYIQNILTRNLSAENNSLLVGCELVLLSAYIKDDILDKTISRRGMLTLPMKFGVAHSVMAADHLFYEGVELLSSINEKHEKYIRKEILKAYEDFCMGQFLGSVTMVTDFNLSLYKKIAGLKTSSLVSSLLSLPAILYDQKYLRSYSSIGYQLGLCLQARNDFENIFGSEHKEEEILLEDVRNGDINLLSVCFASSSQKNLTLLLEWGNALQKGKDSLSIRKNVLNAFYEANTINKSYGYLVEETEKLVDLSNTTVKSRSHRAELNELIVQFLDTKLFDFH